jgi:hypothetical protein
MGNALKKKSYKDEIVKTEERRDLKNESKN